MQNIEERAFEALKSLKKIVDSMEIPAANHELLNQAVNAILEALQELKMLKAERKKLYNKPVPKEKGQFTNMTQGELEKVEK
jgi:signal transduction histidine kinase